MGNWEKILWENILKKNKYYDLKPHWEKILKSKGCYTAQEEKNLQIKQIPSSGSILGGCVSLAGQEDVLVDGSGDFNYKISSIESRDYNNIHTSKLYKRPVNDSTVAQVEIYNGRFWKCFSKPIYSKQKIYGEITLDVTTKGILRDTNKAKNVNEILTELHRGPIRSTVKKGKTSYQSKYARLCYSKDVNIHSFLKVAGMKKWRFLHYHTPLTIADQKSQGKTTKINIGSALKFLSPFQAKVFGGFCKNKTDKNMATEFGCSQQNVNKAMKRAIKHYRELEKWREKESKKAIERL